MDDERTKELDSQLNSPPEEDPVENDPEPEEEVLEDEEDTNEEENQEEESQEEKAEEQNKKELPGEPAKQDNQDRWHGKSREEVIKNYEELEQQSTQQKNKKPDDKPEPKKQESKKESGDELGVPSDEDLAKMTPKDFAQWMIQTVSRMVEKTYDTRGQVKDAVRGEIRQVQKEHPLLKTNQEYRDLVLAMIDTAAKKGTVLPLKEACSKVDGLIGKVKGEDGENKVSDEDKARLKKAKAQVERGAGAPTSPGEDKGAEQKRLESIFGTGRSKSPFGGLGV